MVVLFYWPEMEYHELKRPILLGLHFRKSRVSSERMKFRSQKSSRLNMGCRTSDCDF